MFGWPHVCPNKSAPLMCGIRAVLDFFNQATACRLGGHVHDIARHIHLPAMVETTQAAVFVAAIDQRSFAVRTVFIHHTHPAFRVPEDHQVFAQNSGLDGRAIGLRHFFHQTNGNPLTAHELPHGRLAFNAAQQVVFFGRDHDLDIQSASFLSDRLAKLFLGL